MLQSKDGLFFLRSRLATCLQLQYCVAGRVHIGSRMRSVICGGYGTSQRYYRRQTGPQQAQYGSYLAHYVFDLAICRDLYSSILLLSLASLQISGNYETRTSMEWFLFQLLSRQEDTKKSKRILICQIIRGKEKCGSFSFLSLSNIFLFLCHFLFGKYEILPLLCDEPYSGPDIRVVNHNLLG